MYLLKLFVQNAAKAIRNAELSEKLLQKEKLSAVGNAVGMVMHDLRSPIKNIAMLTNILRREGTNNKWVDAIDESARQASEVFDDFLDFINETPVKKLPLYLDKVIAEGIKMSESKNSLEHVHLVNSVPANLLIHGDESKLKRAIMNIVNNAVEALNDHKVPMPSVRLAAHLNNKGDKVILTISDNGPGIPPVIMKTLFDPFVTRKKANGTGLGLAIVKQYIVAHGGTIEVENHEGAVFTISLPVFKS
jgi:signal transduction histidine kinase